MFGRRAFLKRLFVGGAAVAAAATAGSLLDLEQLDGAGASLLDPERKLWTPGTKTFFIPDDKIAIKNIRQATPQEVSQLTGQHMVRVKFKDAAPLYLLDASGRVTGMDDATEAAAADRGRTIEQIVMMSEAEFVKNGAVAFATARDLELHFDNGAIARNFNATDAPNLAAIKERTLTRHLQETAARRERYHIRDERDPYIIEDDEDWTW